MHRSYDIYRVLELLARFKVSVSLSRNQRKASHTHVARGGMFAQAKQPMAKSFAVVDQRLKDFHRGGAR